MRIGKRPRDIVSYNMSRIRSKNTRLERKFADILSEMGITYAKHHNVIGKPDFALPEFKIAMFVDSHFWHGFQWKKRGKKEIKTRRAFWIKKIERNMSRDREVNRALKRLGWLVIRFWEDEVSNSPEKCAGEILSAIAQRQVSEVKK